MTSVCWRTGYRRLVDVLTPEAGVLRDRQIAFDPELARQSQAGIALVRWEIQPPSLDARPVADRPVDGDRAGATRPVAPTVQFRRPVVVWRQLCVEQDIPQDRTSFTLDRFAVELDCRHSCT